MKIKKRIIFSRHGLRYPLFDKKKIEEKIGFPFVNWDFDNKEMGYLTEKGEMLEFKFGHELRKMLNYPIIDSIYTNSMHRTYLTARILSLAIMPFSTVDVKMRYNDFEKTDERFNFVLNKEYIIDDKYAKEVDLKLADVYKRMKELTKVKVFDEPTKILINQNGEFRIKGALRYATDLCDLYILKYYQGFNERDIFESDTFMDDLKLMSRAKDEFLDVVFGNKDFLDNSTSNIIEILKSTLNNDDKLSIIVGHDSNLSALMTYLNINYKVNSNNCIEKYPIGAKMIFNIYEDNSYQILYVYQDYRTIRYIDDKKPIVEILKEGTEVSKIFI